MSWITITTESVKSRLTAGEIAALQDSGVEAGQADPLQEAIEGVVEEIRASVETGGQYVMGAEGSIPARLQLCALNRIRYEALSRLPNSALLTEERKAANDSALEMLKSVREGKYALGEDAAPALGAWGSRTRIE